MDCWSSAASGVDVSYSQPLNQWCGVVVEAWYRIQGLDRLC